MINRFNVYSRFPALTPITLCVLVQFQSSQWSQLLFSNKVVFLKILHLALVLSLNKWGNHSNDNAFQNELRIWNA